MKPQIFNLRQCDPKKCSGKRIIKFEIVNEVNKKGIKNSILLSPFSNKSISQSDRNYYLNNNITVVDGSWNQIDEIKHHFDNGLPRALPFLVAANPTNFGKPTKLNSAEALSAALWILDETKLAKVILSKFKWGKAFIEINMERLEGYKLCSDSDEIIKLQNKFLNELYG